MSNEADFDIMEEEMEQMLAFMNAAAEVVEERGKAYEFICSVCLPCFGLP